MATKWPDKDPDAIKDYSVDWSAMLAESETITDSSWAPSDPALIVESASPHAPSILGGVCSCWLSGGVAGTTYTVTNRITTSRGMVDDRTVTIKVKEL